MRAFAPFTACPRLALLVSARLGDPEPEVKRSNHVTRAIGSHSNIYPGIPERRRAARNVAKHREFCGCPVRRSGSGGAWRRRTRARRGGVDSELGNRSAPFSMENRTEIQNELRNERADVRSSSARDPFVASGQPFESRVLRHLEPLEPLPLVRGAELLDPVAVGFCRQPGLHQGAEARQGGQRIVGEHARRPRMVRHPCGPARAVAVDGGLQGRAP